MSNTQETFFFFIEIKKKKNLRCLCEESNSGWWNFRLGEGWVGSGMPALKWSLWISATLEGTSFILSSSHPSWFVVLSLIMAVLVAHSLVQKSAAGTWNSPFCLFHQNTPVSWSTAAVGGSIRNRLLFQNGAGDDLKLFQELCLIRLRCFSMTPLIHWLSPKWGCVGVTTLDCKQKRSWHKHCWLL